MESNEEKKILGRCAAIIASAALAAAALAGCASPSPSSSSSNANSSNTARTASGSASPSTNSSSASPNASEDGQNPVMNFIGTYADGRASILVECDGADGAKFEVIWGSSAKENDKWVMSGKFDEKTLSVKYSNCVHTRSSYSESGEVLKTETLSENGTGTITFVDGTPLKLTWIDDINNVADGMEFEYVGSR